MNIPAERTSDRPHRRKTPSFSSSLLDSIFRSIDVDQSTGLEHQYNHEYNAVEELFHHQQQSTSVRPKHRATKQQEIPSLGRDIMMEKRTEDRRNRSRNFGSYNSSSSGSSSGATFSSSSEPGYNIYSRSTPTPSSNQLRHAIFPSPTEIATCFEQTPKRAGEGKFIRMTKLRALKIYGDLKKVKQPISPGGRISNFLNSILGNSRNLKKAKLGDHEAHAAVLRKSRSVKDLTTTAKCSNSFSRSCWNEIQPPLPLPLRDSSTSSSKRSVRFYPINVIVDEDSRHCGKKSIYRIDPSRENLSYQSKNVFRNFVEEDEDEDEDDESCSSSDLFELEIVGGVGIGAYREELPVFGTTNLKTNLAIANACIRFSWSVEGAETLLANKIPRFRGFSGKDLCLPLYCTNPAAVANSLGASARQS